VVPYEGNVRALEVMAEVFELRPHFEWRGLGFISQSALTLKSSFADYDAEVRFALPNVRVTDPRAAQCGEILKGVLKPPQCKLFGKECNPEHPVGALMVSSEGACAAYYRYARIEERTDEAVNA
jgi:hydrogenase expression/formation protein HypD